MYGDFIFYLSFFDIVWWHCHSAETIPFWEGNEKHTDAPSEVVSNSAV